MTAKAVASYTYPASGANSVRPHAVTAAGANAYGYDQNGNMVTRTLASGTFYLRYDPENRLLAVDRQDGEALARSAEFGYDGDGSRVLGVVTGTSAVRTVYVGVYYEWVEGSGARRYYTHAGKRVAMRDTAGALRWLFADHLGSTSITADGDPVALSGELRYAPWGETRYEWGTTPTKRRYTGQIEENSIELYLIGAWWQDDIAKARRSPIRNGQTCEQGPQAACPACTRSTLAIARTAYASSSAGSDPRGRTAASRPG